MRDNMYEGRWSPFDPEWYHQAFDKFISTADELFNQDEIIRMGFHLPDSDGSKSSVFRTDAVLNNSFDEKVLRETLMDIYLKYKFVLMIWMRLRKMVLLPTGLIKKIKVLLRLLIYNLRQNKNYSFLNLL